MASGLALPPVWAVPRKNCGGGREQRRSLARWGGAERPALESVRARNRETCAQSWGAHSGGHSAARSRAGREGNLGSVDRDLSPEIALSCPLPSSRPPQIWSLRARDRVTYSTGGSAGSSRGTLALTLPSRSVLCALPAPLPPPFPQSALRVRSSPAPAVVPMTLGRLRPCSQNLRFFVYLAQLPNPHHCQSGFHSWSSCLELSPH